MNKTGAEDLGDFYPIRPECQADTPKPRFKPRAGKTLSERRWNAAFSEDGHLNIEKVLRRIQRGGVHPSIKGSVWEFLLGCFDPNSTYDERNQLRQHRREQYSRWKAECQYMVPVIGSGKLITTPIITDHGQPVIDYSITDDKGQQVNSSFSDKRSIQWMLALPQIGLDVVRTDRALSFYESEKNQAKLWDILAVYAWVDNDISYVQGMNDICSPMIILLENEADAFWCFEHAMRRLRENFRSSASSMGVQTQLSTLSQVIKIVDPKLHQHLEDVDGGEYLFAFRMLMVLFRREFSFADALYLWELMWAMEYNPNIFSLYEKPIAESDKSAAPMLNNKLLKQCGKFERKKVKTGCKDQESALAVFLVASVLEAKNKRILKEAKGLDDVVQILNDITGNMDARKVCKEALKIYKKYLSKFWNAVVSSLSTLADSDLDLSFTANKYSVRMEGNVIAAALEKIEHVKSPEGEVLTMPFLDLCKTVLPVLDNFGPAMAPAKSDIGGNISRLENMYLSNQSEFNHLYMIVRSEIESKKAKSSSSCTNALLWLTRAMDFLSELFCNLLAHPDWSMSHVALKLAPDRKKFMSVVGVKGDDVSDMEKFSGRFSPLLEENHKFLASVGMDNLKA
ncbi:unnamed protein product [Dovyalis caffra]|uniref:Rab-GAP TBC domain-containing protein n=1 Tax=Dovyalis caffra TaxID=77055 RepID=A0AAV1S4J7_9ROSI|nr:unnamed protein product [Dovyalis caffra]